ncbi:MAG: dihydroxyacetone kinase phosphoryl donor subunit DhaM [Actinomycetota bacterium]
MRVALVVVAHSARLAEGVVEVATQMAPDVQLRAAGGTDAGGVGTSFDRVARAVGELLEDGHPVVVLTDLGSATMTAAAALESQRDGAPARLADAPLVEGAVAAAVAAQIGRPLDEVVAAAEGAGAPPHPAAAPATGAVTRVATLVNDIGLHARPAAMLANLAARFDAEVTVNGADATSVTDLLLLDLGMGAEVEISATGPEATEAVGAVAALVDSGFA